MMEESDRNSVSRDGEREWQGCDPYNGQVTGDVSGTITCFVGSSTSKGPKIIDSKTCVKCGLDSVKSESSKKEQSKMEKTSEEEMRSAVEDINRDAPHQQDQVNYHKDAARTLAAGTHGSAPHLTKTVIEKEGDDDEEMMTVVRRLTPKECSRLQGFTEGHLDCMGGDSSKYRSAGNSWAVPCAYFNIARIHIVGDLMKMVYATVCSGVEAHSQAVKDMGDEAIFFSEIEKPQSQLLAARYPNVPNCGDFTKIHFDEEKGVITNALKEGETDDLPDCFYHAPVVEIPFKRGGLDLLSGGIPCFTKGTMVLTEKGYVAIEDIRPGDKVVTHLGNLKKVMKVGKMKADNIVEVQMASRPAIRMTADHKFWAAEKIHHSHDNHLVIDSYGFREIASIGMGGYVAQNRKYNIPMPKIPKMYSASEMDVIEIAGWYLGDGYIRDQKDTNKKAVCLCLNDKKLQKFVEKFSGKVNFCLSRERTATKVIIYNTEFARWCEDNFGRLSAKKTVPAWLIGASQETKDSFIAGYLATDGYVDHRQNDMLRFSTVSKSLAYGIADVIGRSCVSVTKRKPTTVIEGRIVKQMDSWNVHASKNANRFHECGQWDFVGVHKIVPCGSDIVYQIMVDGDHSYISNGFCSKNCTDVSVAGKREGMKEGSGTRSSLAFNYQKLIDDLRPTFILYENVPGIFSSNSGRDFIWFVYKMMNAGYSIAWRTLDAQYCMTDVHPRAVPQRRRRLWLIGYKGDDWRVPARVVFEPLSALGEEPPKRIPGKGFQTLNPDFDEEDSQVCDTSRRGKKKQQEMDTFFDCMFEEEKSPDARKISVLPDADDFGSEADITKISEVGIYQILGKFGQVGFCGDVFDGDKQPCTENIAEGVCGKFVKVDAKDEKKQNGDLLDIDTGSDEQKKGEEQRTEATAEENVVFKQVSKGFIGNAGVMSLGKVVTMDCHEWTSGIQLSPANYKRYMDLKAAKKTIADSLDMLVKEGLVPEAYDGTICGLSDILEDDPDPKYNLSWKACYGILKRAENRGKVLPEPLKEALVTTIVESAPLVKWISLNAKKEEDRNSAKKCYDEYIESVYPFDKVVEEAPVKRSDDDAEEEDDGLEDEGVDTGSGDEDSEMGGFEYSEKKEKPTADGLVRCADTKLDASRVETEVAQTILATSFKEPPMIVK